MVKRRFTGFIVNRIFFAILRRLLPVEEGVATVEDIDPRLQGVGAMPWDRLEPLISLDWISSIRSLVIVLLRPRTHT
jgi:3-hydroxyacyl-CoA dehydrogenase